MDDKNSVNQSQKHSGGVAVSSPRPALEYEIYDNEESLDDVIEESVTYYVICDKCRGCTDVPSSSYQHELFVNGWRMSWKDARSWLLCPQCVISTLAASG